MGTDLPQDNFDKGRENVEKGAESKAEAPDLNALDLLREGSGYVESNVESEASKFGKAMRDDPQGFVEKLEQDRKDFDRDFEAAVKSDSPEPLRKMLSKNEQAIKTVQKYVADIENKEKKAVAQMSA